MKHLPLSSICLDGDLQPRAQMDYLIVAEYAADMQAGAAFPPVVVFFDGSTYWLADGFHRITAARDYAGLTEFPADVRQGSKRDAAWFALGATKGHGLRLTNEDKRRIVLAALRDEQWREKSDYEIAAHCGVGHTMVNRHRESIYTKSTDKPTERLATRNGTTYPINVAPIGKRAPVEPPAPQPSLYAAPVAIASRVEIINADAQYLAELVTEPVHLVVTSPPYNVGVEYDVYVDDLSTYIPFVTSVWRQCHKVMVDGARIAVVVPFGVGRNPYTPFDYPIMQTLVQAGFTLRGRIIWDKGTTGNRTSWGSFRLSTDPALRDTTEAIIVAHKGQSGLAIPAEHKQRDAKGTYTPWLVDADYFMALAQDHWVVAPESAQRVKHPAPFPVELVTRLAHFYAYPGAHLLDPFAGSGTVGVAARELGCDATLVEISAAYCELMKARIR